MTLYSFHTVFMLPLPTYFGERHCVDWSSVRSSVCCPSVKNITWLDIFVLMWRDF